MMSPKIPLCLFKTDKRKNKSLSRGKQHSIPFARFNQDSQNTRGAYLQNTRIKTRFQIIRQFKLTRKTPDTQMILVLNGFKTWKLNMIRFLNLRNLEHQVEVMKKVQKITWSAVPANLIRRLTLIFSKSSLQLAGVISKAIVITSDKV